MQQINIKFKEGDWVYGVIRTSTKVSIVKGVIDSISSNKGIKYNINCNKQRYLISESLVFSKDELFKYLKNEL